ncbi:MAG: hypothetical protein NDJ18_04265 [candidate division Zixibacteria bacterium]|nr:hypothetical protein [candidate division Zixibacteria bacterium]
MRQAYVSLLAVLLNASVIIGQTPSWDPESGDAPSTSTIADQPLQKPTKIKPFSIVIFRACEAKRDGTVAYTSRLGIDILSEYGSVGFESTTKDSLLAIRLRTKPGADRTNSILIPRGPFHLHVVLGQDTAKFRVVQDSSLDIAYYQHSDLLKLLETKEVPAGLIYIQCLGDRNAAKRALEEVEKQFGTQLTRFVLANGYYPCLPVPHVSVASLGRKVTANRTSLGYFLCYSVRDAGDLRSLQEWAWDWQQQEFKRFNQNH